MTTDWQVPIQGYVLRGILSKPQSAFTPTCPSGKCTWEQFHTLSMCSKCVDVTDQVTHTGYCQWDQDNPPPAANTTDGAHLNCTYTINNHSMQTTGWYSDMYTPTDKTPAMILSPFIASSSTEPAPAYIAGWQQPAFGVHRLILNQAPLPVGVSPAPLSDEPTRLVQQALECAISFCIILHNATVTGNALALDSSTYAISSTAHYYGLEKDAASLTWRSPTTNEPLNDSLTQQYNSSYWGYGYGIDGMGTYYTSQGPSQLSVEHCHARECNGRSVRLASGLRVLSHERFPRPYCQCHHFA